MKYLNALLVLVLCVAMAACDDEMKFMAEGDPMQISVNATTKYSGAQSRAILGDEVEITGYTFLYYVKKDGNLTLSNKTYSTKSGFSVVIECPGTESNLAILIANAPEDAFDNLAIGSNISELNNYAQDWTHTYNNPPSAKDFTWSGYQYVTQDTRTLGFTLNPNVAKVTLTINDQTGTSELKNIRLKRIRDKVRYAQKALYETGYCNESELEVSERGYFSYDMEDMNGSKNKDGSYSWYVPHNEPYIAAGDDTDYSRETGLVPSGSTFIEIDDQLTTSTNLATSYRLYPGISEKDDNGNYKEYNKISNFKVIADYQYNFTVNITEEGMTYSGTAGSGWYMPFHKNTSLKVKLPGESNCYMIHPKVQNINNGKRVWELFPTVRVNDYWETVKGDASRTLTKYSKWKVEVIWQDINARALHFCDEYGNIKDEDCYIGEGLNPVYFTLDDALLKATAAGSKSSTNDIYGNILIGLKLLDDNGNVVTFSENNAYRRDDGRSDYLWSWHLWITDYYPDGAPAYSDGTAETRYATGKNVIDYQGYDFYSGGSYKADFGGNVQHYYHYGSTYFSQKSRSIWGTPSTTNTTSKTNGIYYNKWIMDRHIGAQSPCNGYTEDPIEGFGLYYQYGRKDPFPYHGSDKRVTGHYIYDISGTNKLAQWEQKAGKVSVSIGVMNPMLDFSYGNSSEGTSWTTEDNGRPWYSPENETEVTNSNGKKTLFDPCPHGWCIPKYDAFDFMAINNGTITSDPNASGIGTVVSVKIFTGSSQSKVASGSIKHFSYATLRGYSGGDGLEVNFPIQGYISPSGVNGSTLQLPKSDDDLDLRGYMWTVDAPSQPSDGKYTSEPSGVQKGLGVGFGVAENHWAKLSALGSYVSAAGGYFGTTDKGAYKWWFSLSRGHNIRCIQVP